jgi:murein DD-endopeptidase MepM/ murein hydrolase activator NlpD
MIYRPTIDTYGISSGRGDRTIIVDGKRRDSFHRGYDIATPMGTPIYPTRDKNGIAYKRFEKNGFGNWVAIKWEDGKGTWIAHMDKVMIENGSSIDFNTLLGYSGKSGGVTGPHYHHEEHNIFDKSFTSYAFTYSDRPTTPDYIRWNDAVKSKRYIDDSGNVGIINSPKTELEHEILKKYYELTFLFHHPDFRTTDRALLIQDKFKKYIEQSDYL